MAIDCDNDTILVKASPEGPTCHLGKESCFDQSESSSQKDSTPTAGALDFLLELESLIEGRKQQSPDKSYTAKLFDKGISRIAQKVGEEGVETALAGALDQVNLRGESADLIYHLLVLLRFRNISFQEVVDLLIKRHGGREIK